MTIAKFSFPTTIHFGAGARRLVADHLHAQGIRRPLVVTDRGIAPLPLLAEFLGGLAGLETGVYSEIWGNPVASQVGKGAAAYRAHDADAVIGLGGGAALDVAKAIALMATHPGDVLEYAWDHPHVRPIDRELPYFVALPTTAGTGSEVGRSSVVSDDATHVEEDRLLAEAPRAVRVRRPRADARPAAFDHGRDRHGRAHAQRRIVPVARIPSAVRRHRARRRAHRCARAAGRRARRQEPRCAQRHADELDDGRDRVPEGPGRGALVRACAVDGRRPPPRARQRHHDRPRDALQSACGDGEDGRARACRLASAVRPQ